MIFYRCDNCNKELSKDDSLYRIKMVAEIYDDDNGAHYWRASRETIFFDVCYECARNLMEKFVNQFIKEGEENEGIS